MNATERPIIAVITTIVSNTAQKELMNGIVIQAKKFGYDTAVFSNIYNTAFTDQNTECEQKIYNLIFSEQISAAILDTEAFTNCSFMENIFNILQKKNIPVVLAGEQIQDIANPNFTYVNTNSTDDFEKLTDHLIEKHGCTKIDILTGPKDNIISQKRINGYKNSLKKHNISLKNCKQHYGNFWMNSGSSLARQYINGEISIPEAIVCANDCMAFGLMKIFRDNGIQVPEDIIVVGYELSGNRIFYPPLLTVYHRNWEQIGQKAVQVIHSSLTHTENYNPAILEGEIIFGDSCPCSINKQYYYSQLENTLESRNFESIILSSTIEQKLTAARNLSEFVSVMSEYHWMVRDSNDIFLCLYSDWYEKNPASSKIMSCRSIMPWLDTTPFEIHELDFRSVFRRESQPAVYYFIPLFFSSHYFGHLVLKYLEPDSYDEALRSWTKSIATGLEFLRMKNDIQYLINCQDLSDSRDTLTGMYNKKGLLRSYRSNIQQNSTNVYFIMLKVCSSASSVFAAESEQKIINFLINIAKGVQRFCGNQDISGYTGDNTFICFVQSNASIELICSTLNAVIIQYKDYIAFFGMDSFICTGIPCNGNNFETLYNLCRANIEEKQNIIKNRYTNPHYREMLKLRNHIYMYPEMTFEQSLSKIYPENMNSMRIMYKKCFGISFHQDCINARISKAKYYLSSTSFSLIEIAEKCGYIDHKYFQRQFNANSGITAGQYRNVMKS